MRDTTAETPDELRRLAEWYRSMADIGHSDERAWRAGFAEYLEKRAAELALRESGQPRFAGV